jgi:hypothetical protein
MAPAELVVCVQILAHPRPPSKHALSGPSGTGEFHTGLAIWLEKTLFLRYIKCGLYILISALI